MRGRIRSGGAAIVLAAALAACGGSDARDTGPTAVTAATGSSSGGLSGATGATATGATAVPGASGPTASGSTGSIPSTDLDDGRHFGYISALHPDGELRFDLAYFLTGDDASQAAEDHGDEAPPPNDYYIVNDNPRIRTLALSPQIDIEVFDWNRCCDETVSIDVADLRRALASGVEGVDVDGALVHGNGPWWLTLEGGVVTKIEEQFLP